QSALTLEVELPTPATATTASPSWTEGAMTPRSPISTSAYAFNSDTLDGLDSTAFAAASGSTSYIQNTSSPQTANFNITGTGTASLLQTATLDQATSGTLTIGGTNTTSIVFADSAVLAANTSLTITGGTTASRPASPTEGMVYYDTTTKQLLTYANGKWQADRSTATKIVAASNSSQALKDAADYVATGAGDQTTINAALTVAAGGKVYLTEGIYTVDNTILVPNNTTLAGAGAGTVIEFANLGGIYKEMINNSDTTTGTGVHIRDVSLNGRKDINTATQMGIYFRQLGSTTRQGGSVQSVVMTNFNGDGLYLENSFNNTITGNKVIGADYGLDIDWTSSNNIFSDNYLTGNDTGIYISGTYNTINNNTFFANTNGIQMDGGSNTISGNFLDSNTNMGIWVNVDHLTITGNTIRGGATGILAGTTDSTISGNTIYESSARGIDVRGRNNTVTGNTIGDSGGATTNDGLYVFSDSTTIIGNIITDTSCTTTCYAINIASSLADTNYLASNTFSASSGTATINDLGTGTIYAGQSMTQGGLDIRFKQANSTSAFAIQNAAGMSLLTADTSGNTLQIGSSTTDANAIMLGLDSYNNGTDPTGFNGAMYYNTSLNKFRCYQNGAWADCIGSGASLSANNTWTGTNLFKTDSTAALQVQNAAGTTTLLTADTTNNKLVLGTATTLAITGDTRTNINAIATPTEGMTTYDITNKQLLTYSNGKWQADRTDAVLVAASNSSAADKAAADYVGDGDTAAAGDGDQVQINQALIAASGKKVILLAGTYTIDASISIPNNTTLSGIGQGTLITIPNALNVAFSAIVNTDTTTGTNVTLRDLILDGNKANQSGLVGMAGVDFTGMGGGTGASARQGARITNVQANNWYKFTGSNCQVGAGICLRISSNNILTSNTAQGNSGEGIYLTFSSSNILTSNTAQGNNWFGISLSSANNNILTSNTAQGNSHDGIYLIGSSNNIIGSNKIHDNMGGAGNNGIYLFASDSNTITGNDITDTSCTSTCYAINISDSTSNYLTGNTFSGTTANIATIYDTSTSTRYSNQMDGAGNLINKGMGALTVGTSTVSGTLSLQGGLTATALPTPTAPTIATVGTAGATSYSYTVTALDGVGETIASTAGSTATGNATLNGTNYNTITWSSISGATSYKIYRTVSGGTPATTGLIATVTTKLGATQTTNDTGLAASGSSPTTNTTGGATFASSLQGGSSLTLGTSSSIDGSIVLKNTANANTITLQTGATGASYSLVLPTSVGTTGQCLSTTVTGSTSTLGWAACSGGGGGATTALDNLASVNINQSLTANANNTLDIGSSGTAWRSGYFATSVAVPAIRPLADSTTAFKLQNTAGTVDFLTLDTTNNRLTIGTSDTTGTLLVLDTKTNAGDPTGVNGAMYYNSDMRKFRCYENGAWSDCIGIMRPAARRFSYLTYPGSGTTFNLVGDISTATGTPAAFVSTTTEPGGVSFPTTATLNSAAGNSGNINYDTDNNITYQTYAAIPATTLTRVWLGVTNQILAIMGASANPAGNYAAFRYDTSVGDTNFMCVTKNVTTINAVSSGVPIDTAGHEFEIRQSPTEVTFYIDGVRRCTNTTSLPIANTLLRYVNSVTTLEAVIKSLRVSFVYIESNK
ncbi:MAG: right-handed parallel beta-helix repeat-containing protein, partial [Candidatus Saccharimonas sp.]